jgi:photosystem II stability/assembly factor-like uncharacterized protein
MTMKKILLPSLALLLSVLCVAQGEWTLIHPYPTVNNLIDAHFISDNEGWVVGYGGTILYTADGGVNWELQHSQDGESLWSIFFIDDQEGWACGWSEIYHTGDGGQNWEQQAHPSCLGDLTDVYFINPDTGWIVGTYKIVLKTTDGGKNWTKIMNNIYQEGCFKRVEFYDHLHGCAVGDHMTAYPHEGFAMVTDDGGLTWTETTPEGCAWLTDVTYYNDMCVWACGYDGGLYRSLDGGYTWFDEFEGQGSFQDIHFFDKDAGMALEGHYARLTFDGGDTWDSLVLMGNYYDYYRAFMSWEPFKGVAVGGDGVMSKTLDSCQTWQSMHGGLRLYFGQIGFFDSYNGYALGWEYSNTSLVSTADGGHTWQYDTLVENGPFSIMYLAGQQCYLLNQDSLLLMKTMDAAQSWEMTGVPEPISYYSDMFFVNENTGFLCGGDGYFLRTENGGTDWTDLSPGNDMALRNLHFVDEDNGWMIDYDGKNILHTTDGGENWTETQLGSGIIYQPEDIFFLDAATGFLNTDDGLFYKSTDGGATWEVIYGFPTGSYSSIYFADENEGWFLSARVHHTLDGGATWDEGQYFGLHARAMFFLDEDKGWISGTDGLVVRYDGTVGISGPERNAVHVRIFPNPARDVIQLENIEGASGNCEILIYNIEGQIVLQQVPAVTSGMITLDVSSLAPGTYLLKLKGAPELLGSKFMKY